MRTHEGGGGQVKVCLRTRGKEVGTSMYVRKIKKLIVVLYVF